MVCSTDHSKAVVPVLVLLFVALWLILRCDLLYVFPCVILLLCFSVLLVLRLPRLGKRELILVLFVRLFGLCLFRFVGFLFLLGSGKGCGLWLWHSLDFSLTYFTTPSFPPDLAPCDFFFFPKMKTFLIGRRHRSRQALGSAVYQYLTSISKSAYRYAFRKWTHRLNYAFLLVMETILRAFVITYILNVRCQNKQFFKNTPRIYTLWNTK